MNMLVAVSNGMQAVKLLPTKSSSS